MSRQVVCPKCQTVIFNGNGRPRKKLHLKKVLAVLTDSGSVRRATKILNCGETTIYTFLKAHGKKTTDIFAGRNQKQRELSEKK